MKLFTTKSSTLSPSQHEDFYWGMLAAQAEKEGYLGTKETAKKLEKYTKRAGIGIKDETSGHHKTGG